MTVEFGFTGSQNGLAYILLNCNQDESVTPEKSDKYRLRHYSYTIMYALIQGLRPKLEPALVTCDSNDVSSNFNHHIENYAK